MKSFGPWSSEIYSGSPDKMLLSTFWKQRLALLLPTSRLNARVLRRTWCAVLSIAVLLAVLPAVRAVPAQPPDTSRATELLTIAGKAKAKASRPGHLYVRGFVYRNDKLFGMWIVRVDPKTGAWTKLIGEGNTPSTLRVSPDGQTIAYNKGGEIWTADSKTAASPGKISEANGTPIWSPDGKSIIVTDHKKVKSVKNKWTTSSWKFTETGANREPLEQLKTFPVEDWSPDGKWLIRGGNKGLSMISHDGKRKRVLKKARGWSPRFSPDGKRIAFNQGWSGKLQVTDLEGKKSRTFFEAGNLVHTQGAVWSPNTKRIATLLLDMQLDANGKKFLTADPAQTHPRIAIIDPKTGKQRTLKLPVVKDVRFEPTGVHDWR